LLSAVCRALADLQRGELADDPGPSGSRPRGRPLKLGVREREIVITLWVLSRIEDGWPPEAAACDAEEKLGLGRSAIYRAIRNARPFIEGIDLFAKSDRHLSD